MTRRFSIITLGGLLSLLSPLPGCSEKEDTNNTEPRRNVLMVVIDTLRVDKLGCYGCDLDATPRIDQLAREGVRFKRAYSHAPWTLPAFASILTSLYPPQHGAGGYYPKLRKLPETVRTVSEVFRDAGYATFAVINVDWLSQTFGMTQGFDDVDFEGYGNNIQVRPAARTTDTALAWLGERGPRPFFLVVHYFDPHLVYAPPPEYRKRFAQPEDQNDTSWVFGKVRDMFAYRQGKVRFSIPTIRRAEHLYNGEVAYTDHEVGRLLDGLQRLDLAASTIVVLTADHGEEFLDHGGFEHGHTLYEELVHIPLIIRGVNGFGARTVPSVVGHVDVAPTLCELAGVEPDPAFVGRSLVGLMSGMADADHPIVLEGNFWGKALRGWLQDGYKLIMSENRPTGLFNIIEDPQEKQDLRGIDTERVRRMAGDMELAYKKMLIHIRGSDVPVTLSPEELRRLRSLGYTGE